MIRAANTCNSKEDTIEVKIEDKTFTKERETGDLGYNSRSIVGPGFQREIKIRLQNQIKKYYGQKHR